MPTEGAPDQPVLGDLDFHYIKSNLFRVAHADGAFGSIMPQGNLHMMFFAERPVIPNVIKYHLLPTGQLGPEGSRESKTGVVREVEVDVIMSVAAAKGVRDWLDQRIREMEGLLAMQDATGKVGGNA